MKIEENRLNDQENYEIIVNKLNQRGVDLKDIASLVVDLQKPYLPNLKFEDALEHVKKVIMKREVQNAALVGIELDILAEKKIISEPLLSKLVNDEGLFGVDEVLALAIVNVYGSIGFTNFGYVDKIKPGIIGELDKRGKETDECHTFLDDIIGAIAAAAASSLAHRFSK